MSILILGLVLFLGSHVFTMFRGPRRALINSIGANGYKIGYSLVSIIGFALIIIGFGLYRQTGWTVIWQPPTFTKHLALLLMLPVFTLLLAPYLPGRIKTATKHPMLLAVKIWATSHLLSNGDLGGMLMFGGFLVWAVAARISLKRRTDPTILPTGPERPLNDVIALAAGVAIWAAFVFWLHPLLFGVAVWPGR
jgi:uncharacterized membrane protein